MKSCSAVFVITVLMTNEVFSQVHIQEKAIISPAQPRKIKGGGVNNHKLSYAVSWTDVEDSVAVLIDDPCGYEIVSSVGGSLTGEIQAPVAGHYGFGVYRKAEYFSGICLRVCYDDSLIYSGCDAGSLVEDGPWYWLLGLGTGFTTPYFSKFDFSLEGHYLTHGQSAMVYVGGYDDSTATAWSPDTDPITVTIISGSQYASFHESDPQSGVDDQMGSTITTTQNNLPNVYLVGDGVLPESGPGWVVVEATSNGLTRVDSLEVPPPPIVEITPSEISPGDTALINVFWQNPDGTLTDYSSVTYGPLVFGFEAGIWSGGNCGMLLASWGEEETYFSLVSTPLYFVAADSIDCDSVRAGIRVGISVVNTTPCSKVPDGKASLGRDPKGAPSTTSAGIVSSDVKSSAKKVVANTTGQKLVSDDNGFSDAEYGIGYAEIKEPQITIDIPAPKQIWPTLPPESGGNPNEKNVQYFTVTVTSEGNPLPDYDVILTATMILPSGGHSHTNQPPTDEMGELEDYVNDVDSNGTITTTTDQNGEINVAFTAPEFSGNVLMTATSTTKRVKANDTVLVKVPDLATMDGGANLITYTSSETLHRLADSEYGTPATNAGIVDAVEAYSNQYMMDSSIFLAALDMSLPWGGLFDYQDGDWHPPHQYHRVGKSVDFSHFYTDASGKRTPLMLYVDGKPWKTFSMIDEKTLDDCFKQEGFVRWERSIHKIHYELRK